MVEAKDGGNHVCGPVNNAFSDMLVSLDQSNDLTLNFRYANGFWYGSEVRIVRQSAPYSYGTFSFSVKEIRVIENGTIVDNVLPPGLVLGMFTWDPFFNGTQPDIYEVDIEVSRWGNASNDADAQFVIQPPVPPHFYRFSTASNGVISEAPQMYQFTWLPTSVAWYSTANGGQNLLYTTQQALSAGQTDLIQCIPSTIEARISLWSIGGSTIAPVGMNSNQYVQVVIDNFTFNPANVTGVASGQVCSKNCQCLSGSCQNAVCA
jgi:hypothetical protein